MEKIRNKVAKVINAINYVGMAVCFVMVFVVAFDVILRKVSGQHYSIKGSNEFSQYFLVVMCMLAIPALQVKKGHVWVNMFVDKFPAKFRSYWMGVITLIETLVSAAFCYGCFSYATSLITSGRASDVLNMPLWPFTFVCSLGFLEFTVILLIDTIMFFQDGAKSGKKLQKDS